MNVFSARGVTVTYKGAAQPAVHNVSITVPRGSFTAIIGPNGSGKSTLLRALLGAVPMDRGEAHFEGRVVRDYTRVDLAKRVGAVTQIEEMPFPVTVRELVATGRYAHLGAWRAEGETDR